MVQTLQNACAVYTCETGTKRRNIRRRTEADRREMEQKGRSAGMSFMQVFGATVIAIAVYIVALFAIGIFGWLKRSEDENLVVCLVSGVVLFTCLFMCEL